MVRDSRVDGAERLDIWIEGDSITALCAPGEGPRFAEPVEHIDGRGCVAIPGLINGHSHSASALLRGTCAGEPLDLFVLEAMRRTSPRTDNMVRVSALLHSLELLKRGVTSHVDHFRDGASPTVAGVNAALGAYRDIGIRAMLAPMYEDRPYAESLPIDMASLPDSIRSRFAGKGIPAPEAYFENLGEVAARWRGAEGRLDVMLGVDGPQRCTARLLEMTGEFARKHNMGNHTHVLEAKTQALVADRVGGSLVGWLDRFGLVNENSSFAHFVWANERDIELVAERGATPVHNPVSNLHLGSGVARIPYLLREGIDVAMGTDGGGGHGLSILEQAKFAALLSRMTEADPGNWVGARAAFRMATENGAKMIGMRDRLGRIAPGMKADIALIDTTGIDWFPRGELFTHLVMYDTGRSTRTVLVAGEVVLRDGVSTRIDEADLLAEAQECAAKVMRDNADAMAQFDAERPAWRPLIVEAIGRPLEVDRLML